MSIKRTSLNLQELHKLDSVHIPYLINEHFLTLNVVMQSLLSLSKNKYENELYDSKAYQMFFEKTYMRYLRAAGCKDTVEPDYTSPSKFFASLYEHLFLMSCDFLPYITNLIFSEKSNFLITADLISSKEWVLLSANVCNVGKIKYSNSGTMMLTILWQYISFILCFVYNFN